MNSYQPKLTKMRKIVIAGTYAQYRDWLSLHNGHQMAAPYVDSPQALLNMFDAQYDEIELVGTFRDNAAYQSDVYRWCVASMNSRPTVIAV